MPSKNRVGSEVSSKTSKFARKVDPPPGGKRRVRERIYGVIVRSLPENRWEVKWGEGQIESMHVNQLKHVREATPRTLEIAALYNRQR